jgi:hypothetical protein
MIVLLPDSDPVRISSDQIFQRQQKIFKMFRGFHRVRGILQDQPE